MPSKTTRLKRQAGAHFQGGAQAVPEPDRGRSARLGSVKLIESHVSERCTCAALGQHWSDPFILRGIPGYFPMAPSSSPRPRRTRLLLSVKGLDRAWKAAIEIFNASLRDKLVATDDNKLRCAC